MADWCPLFGAIDPAWPDRARAVITEARRILGVKGRTRAASFAPDRLAKARALFAVAPQWIEYVQGARQAAVAQPSLDALAFDLETAAVAPGHPCDHRTGACVLAISLARQACLERTVAPLMDAEAALAQAQAYGQRASLGGAGNRGTKGVTEPPEGHATVIAIAYRMLAEDKPRYGLAGRIVQAMGQEGYTKRTVNRVLKEAGVPSDKDAALAVWRKKRDMQPP